MSDGNKSRLYNSRLKLKFIENYTSADTTTTYLVSIFSSTSSMEYLSGCDVALLSTEKLQSIFKNNFGIRQKAQLSALKVIEKYTEWYYMQTEKPEQAQKIIDMYKKNLQGIWGVTVEKNEKIKSKMISSPKQLSVFLNSVFESPKIKTVDCVYKSFFWFAYMGIKDSDAVNIHISDVDLVNKVITYEGRKYNIFDEALDDVKNACECEEFLYIHKKPDYEILKPRLSGDTVIRGLKETSRDITHLRSHLCRKIKNYNASLANNTCVDIVSPTYKSLILSGLFYRAYMNELNGLDAEKEIREYVNHKIEDKKKNKNEYVLSGTKTIEYIEDDNVRELLKDYECWKIVFYK